MLAICCIQQDAIVGNIKDYTYFILVHDSREASAMPFSYPLKGENQSKVHISYISLN